MRIISNFFGKLKTYGFNKSYDTKKFFQTIEVPHDNYEVKLINMFSLNESYERNLSEYLNNFSQYIRVNWGDDSIYKSIEPEIINSGKNNNSGAIIRHTFKKKGRYDITIESVEDLVVVESNYNFNQYKTSNPCDVIQLKTVSIGGTIHQYIPPSNTEIERFEHLLDTTIDEYIDQLNITNLSTLDYNINQNDKNLSLPSSWCLTVQYIENLSSPLIFTNKFMNNSEYGIDLNINCLFAKWSSFTENGIHDLSTSKVDDTFYNLFKSNIRSISMTGCFAHSKNFHRFTEDFNLSLLISKYIYDFDDYISNDEYLKITSLKFVMWNIKSSDSNVKIKTLSRRFDYFNIFESIKSNPDFFKGSFGMIIDDIQFKDPFSFNLLMVDTSTGNFYRDSLIQHDIDLSYMFMNSKCTFIPYKNLSNDYNFYDNTVKNYNIKLKAMFMNSGYVPNEVDTKININSVNYFSYIPIPSLKDSINCKYSVNLNSEAMFANVDPDMFNIDLNNYYEINGESNVTVSIFDYSDSLSGNISSVTNTSLIFDKMFILYRDLNFNIKFNKHRLKTKFFREEVIEDISVTNSLTLNQSYISMFKSINQENRIVRLDLDLFKLYIPFKSIISKESGSNINVQINYSNMFESTNIENIYSGNNIDFLQPVGVKYLEKWSSNTLSESNFNFGVNMDEIFLNSDYDTKELGLQSLYPITNFTIKSERNDYESILSEVDLVGLCPRILSMIRAFSNTYEKIYNYFSRPLNKALHFKIRNREYYKTHKEDYRLNLYGLNVSELFFNDKNFDKNANMSEVFKNNISMNIKYIYTNNSSFKLNIERGYNLKSMFSISEQINYLYDNANNHKVSEYEYKDSSDESDSIIKYTTKNGFIIDQLRVLKIRNLISDINSLSSSEFKVRYQNLANMFSGRVSPTSILKYLVVYDTDFIESYSSYVYDNFNIEEFISSYSLANRIIRTDKLNLFDSFVGVFNLSSLEELESYTNGYMMTFSYIESSKQKENISSLKIKFKNNLLLAFGDETLYHDNPISYDIYGETNKKIRLYIEVEDNFIKYEIPYNSSLLNSEVSITLDKPIRSNIIETRIYTKMDEDVNFIEDIVPIVQYFYSDNTQISNAYYTSIYTITESLKLFGKKSNNGKIPFSILNDMKALYLTPFAGSGLSSIVHLGNHTTVYIMNSAINSAFFALRDTFDVLYNKSHMTTPSRYTIIFSKPFRSVVVLRDNDLKFMSFFDEASDIDFIDNIKFIDGDGLIHNDYLKEGVPVSKLSFIKNFMCSSVLDKSNLVSITGRLCNINGNINFNDKIFVPPKKTKSDSSTYRFNIVNFFYRDEDDITKDIFINPNFISGLSFMNTHVHQYSLCNFKNLFNFYNPVDKKLFGSILEDNIICNAENFFKSAHKGNYYKKANNLDEYSSKDIIIYFVTSMNYDNQGITFTDDDGSFRHVMPLPKNVMGNKCSRIIFKTIKNHNTEQGIFPKIDIYTVNFFNPIDNVYDPNPPESFDDYLFKYDLEPILDFSKVTASELGSDIPKDNGTNTQYLIQKNLKVFNPNVKVTGNESLLNDNVIPNSNNISYHYISKLIFNKACDKSFNEKDIIKMVYNNSEVYGLQLDSIKLNCDCDIEIKYQDKDHSDSLLTNIVKSYNRGTSYQIPRNIYIKSVNIINIRNTEYTDRLIECDFKVRMQRTLKALNNDLFKSRVFVKDNGNRIFEMMQLRMRKKSDYTPSVEGDKYWHINITQSSLTKNKELNDVLKSSLYKGEIIFTKSLVKYDNRVEPGYLKNNSLVIDVPIDQEDVTIYVMNDTPFSLYNSDGVVKEIRGDMGYDILCYYNVNEDRTAYLSTYLSELCNNNFCDFIDRNHFNGVNTLANITTEYYLSFESFTIKRFDLDILSDFLPYGNTLSNSFNNRSIPMRVIGYIHKDNCKLSIIDSFNGVYDEVGLSSLSSPFKENILIEISRSFNPDNNSINKFLPSYLLDSKIFNTLTITDSFNNVISVEKLRRFKTGEDFSRNQISCRSSFNNSILDTICNDGNYISYILNTKMENEDKTQLISLEDIKTNLGVLKQYISNNTINSEDEKSHLNKSRINKELNLQGRL